MKRHAAIALLFTCCLILGMGSDHPPVGPDSALAGNSDWPQGLVALANQPNRIHGYWVNSSDVFFYQGETQALNAFLADCAELENTRFQVVFHPGPKRAQSPWTNPDATDHGQADWTLYTTPFTLEDLEQRQPGEPLAEDAPFYIQVDIYLGHQVSLEGLIVPDTAILRAGGEIEAFIHAHQQAHNDTVAD